MHACFTVSINKLNKYFCLDSPSMTTKLMKTKEKKVKFFKNSETLKKRFNVILTGDNYKGFKSNASYIRPILPHYFRQI